MPSTAATSTASAHPWPGEVAFAEQYVTDAWAGGRLATGRVDAVAAAIKDRTAPLLADHAPALLPTLAPLSVRDTVIVMRRWAAHADAFVDGADPVAAHRSVHLDRGLDGWGRADRLARPRRVRRRRR